MAIGFNADGENGLTPLNPVNGGLGGYLSDNGVVCNDQVGSIGKQGFQTQFPGTDCVLDVMTGLSPRTVVWNWRIKADSIADMNQIEAIIEDYKIDGRPYELTDADGRTAVLATMVDAQPVEHRRVLPGAAGNVIALWRLTFRVCIARSGATTI